MEKLFVSKPVAIAYKISKNLDHDNLNVEKVGQNKIFGKDCVESFVNEMLEKGTFKEEYFKNEIERNSATKAESYDESNCWLCEKDFISTKRCSKYEKNCGPSQKLQGK